MSKIFAPLERALISTDFPGCVEINNYAHQDESYEKITFGGDKDGKPVTAMIRVYISKIGEPVIEIYDIHPDIQIMIHQKKEVRQDYKTRE